jgi:hypothetical protein
VDEIASEIDLELIDEREYAAEIGGQETREPVGQRQERTGHAARAGRKARGHEVSEEASPTVQEPAAPAPKGGSRRVRGESQGTHSKRSGKKSGQKKGGSKGGGKGKKSAGRSRKGGHR